MNKSLFSVKRATFHKRDLFFPHSNDVIAAGTVIMKSVSFLRHYRPKERLKLFQEIAVPNVLQWDERISSMFVNFGSNFHSFSKKLHWKRATCPSHTLYFWHFSFNTKYSQLSLLPIYYFTNLLPLFLWWPKSLTSSLVFLYSYVQTAWILSVDRIDFQLEAKFWNCHMKYLSHPSSTLCVCFLSRAFKKSQASCTKPCVCCLSLVAGMRSFHQFQIIGETDRL